MFPWGQQSTSNSLREQQILSIKQYFPGLKVEREGVSFLLPLQVEVYLIPSLLKHRRIPWPT